MVLADLPIDAVFVVFLPLLGFLLAGLLGGRLGDRFAMGATTILVCLSAVFSLFVLVDIWQHLDGGSHGGAYTITLMEWMNSGAFSLNWALRVDMLSAVMMVVVTFVSSMVHIYSIGYMAHDPARARFFAYLSLFTFMMLMLVTADNLIQMFFGWEGVGLASYLLIGFWYHKDSANNAAIKAFVVNRVGDFGFALGIFAIFMLFGSVEFSTIFAMAPAMVEESFSFLGYEIHALTLIGLLLFIGAVGKSAQLGLHTWLPDAMEGPTPVSALIHAATMVTAGVFLVARMSPLYEFAPIVLMVITVVGALTAFVAATIGMTQFDIKRVIAYSTMSQLGYMFFALGVSAYSAAIFHLVTHAFFKALLFLGAGAVIHAMSDEQDMRKMGGIWKLVPVTYFMMWIGSLALAGVAIPGVFGLSGYYSKDMILEAAFADHSWFGAFAYWMGIVVVFLTAFYSFRVLIMTFHGRPRADEKVMAHVHESGPVILVPLIFLAVGAIFSGVLGYSWFVGDLRTEFWGNAIFVLPQNDTVEAAHHVAKWVKLLPVAVGFLGIAAAVLAYGVFPRLPDLLRKIFRPLYALFFNRWFFDQIYRVIFVYPAKVFGFLFWKLGDQIIIDGFGPNGVSRLSWIFGRILGAFQTGYLYHYVCIMLLGLSSFIFWFVYRIYF